MKKIPGKARRQKTKHPLEHLELDRADTATTAEPLGRLNGILGYRVEMSYLFLCRLPLKFTMSFLWMENADYVVVFTV